MGRRTTNKIKTVTSRRTTSTRLQLIVQQLENVFACRRLTTCGVCQQARFHTSCRNVKRPNNDGEILLFPASWLPSVPRMKAGTLLISVAVASIVASIRSCAQAFMMAVTTLLSIPGKTFARVVIDRAIPAMHHHRRLHQAGFMPRRSTTDHISAIRLLAEEAREFRKDRAFFIAFIDLKAAFESVDRDCLWHILHSIGIPPKIVRVLERLYTDTSSCVRINNTLSDWFTISSGVRQGCVAAPDLFNCIIDYLMENVSAMVPGIQLGPYHLTDLEYADDAAIFATNQNDISSALAIFDAEACKLSLRTSWAKTKIMKFCDVPSPPSLHICNNDVKFIDKFIYLGSIITNTGDLQPDINLRIGLATGVMRSLRQPLWRHSSISLETKLRVYQASVLSVLLYGSECWPISTSLCSRLSVFDMHPLTPNGLSTKQTLKSEHSQTASRFKDISPKVASAGLAIYSGLH